MIKSNYLTYIHNLRGLAILIIVAIHSRMALFGNDDNSELNHYLTVILDNGTIIFVFISGFLFHHVFIPRLQYKKYLTNKFNYVIIPYFLASILPIIDKLFIDNNIPWMTVDLESTGTVGLLFYMLISGKQFGPYWFIPMITIFYLLAPLLTKLNISKFYLYVFPLFFIVGLFTYRFGYYSNILDSFIFFLPIYLLGMFISQYKILIFKWQHILLPLLTIVFIAILILELKSLIVTPKLLNFEYRDLQYFVFNPAKLRFSVLSIILLIIFKKTENVNMSMLKVLGDYSFGIYFLHLYFIISIGIVLQNFNITLSQDVFSFFLLMALTVFFSTFTVWLIKLIFKNNSRIIIGS